MPAREKPTVTRVVDARPKLGRLATEAMFLGRRFILTDHGKPIAAIVSIEDLEALGKMTRKA